ncbi:hypothetical protein TNIN_116101 [Trichonephila inaurata madagascariensis]|uniref:Uncharacterized protein n=1 Tax=Trichonephila inaurata madagascariensis TaxID=2747483 RepID=A0A8X7BR65_9ARAC|nr:hypothetical protein TNIN_116101 [Trichonephila inaurata madagascariensis]
MAGRQHQLDLLEATDTAEGPSNGLGIDDTMSSAYLEISLQSIKRASGVKVPERLSLKNPILITWPSFPPSFFTHRRE